MVIQIITGVYMITLDLDIIHQLPKIDYIWKNTAIEDTDRVGSGNGIDILSDGFKLESDNWYETNLSTGYYLYCFSLYANNQFVWWTVNAR